MPGGQRWSGGREQKF